MLLRDLRASCARAVQACKLPALAALASCGGPEGAASVPQPSATAGGGGASGAPSASPSATAAPTAATPSAAPTAAPVGCKAGKPNVVSCGGAQVLFQGTREACGLPERGDLPKARCDELCAGFPTRSCHAFQGRDGSFGVFCDAANPCLGRQPARRVPVGRRSERDPVAAHLAFAARMEAASVDAFAELEAELARFGAPRALRASCRRAAADERRHAAAMSELLAARGGRARTPRRRAPLGFASLRALALHNEREGVVGETVGAALAAFQAEASPDPAIRAAMRRVAADELRHAALSLRIAAWARRVLGPRVAATLDATRRRALARAASTRPPHGLDAENALGWPSAGETARLVASLAADLAA